MPQKKNTGFTLVEVLTSIVIIALVAIASYTGFYVLSGGNEVSRNRLQAISVSQAALEEIRGVSRSDFTGLATHYAAHINQTTQTPVQTCPTSFQSAQQLPSTATQSPCH